MRVKWLLAALMTLSMSSVALAASERPVSGLVSHVYALSQTVYLGSSEFYVPDDVYDLSELSAGTYVVITYERSNGRLVAISLQAGIEPQ